MSSSQTELLQRLDALHARLEQTESLQTQWRVEQDERNVWRNATLKSIENSLGILNANPARQDHGIAITLMNAAKAPTSNLNASVVTPDPIKPATPLTPPPGLLSAEAARDWCGGVSESAWAEWDRNGTIPKHVNIGRRVFWRLADLEDWIAWGCPGRVHFEEMRAARDERIEADARRAKRAVS